MSKNSETDIYSRISKARQRNDEFDKFVKLCESRIACWKNELIAENDTPRMIPKAPCDPSSTLVSILLPVVPISPNEVKLLLDYLDKKYLEGDTKTVGGHYFKLRKCFFKENYKLSSHYYHYD